MYEKDAIPLAVSVIWVSRWWIFLFSTHFPGSLSHMSLNALFISGIDLALYPCRPPGDYEYQPLDIFVRVRFFLGNNAINPGMGPIAIPG
ncbi:MAG: hypothetical protein AAF587_27420 [Bacteroidota bacterium]